MRTRNSKKLVTCLCFFFLSDLSIARQNLTIPESSEPLVIDGELNDMSWDTSLKVDQFYQVYPTLSSETNLKTSVKMLMEGDALVVAVRAHDDEIKAIRGSAGRRDQVFDDQDYIELLIDPTSDGKFGHFFRFNPFCQIGDGVFIESSQRYDYNPDLNFSHECSIGYDYWQLEVKIPLIELRVIDKKDLRLNIVLSRNYPRKDRVKVSNAEIQRDAQCTLCAKQVFYASSTSKDSEKAVISPYVSFSKSSDPEDKGTYSAGVDGKFALAGGLIFDATINPDFSQISIDQPQLSSNSKYALSLPEKRPFFQEGTDILEMPIPVVYTRSINDPKWGARVTKRDETYDAVVLFAEDSNVGQTLVPQAYGTGLVEKDDQSYSLIGRARKHSESITLGLVTSSRMFENSLKESNHVGGPDLVFNASENDKILFQYLYSKSKIREFGQSANDLNGNYWYLGWLHDSSIYNAIADIQSIDRDFRVLNGFLPQADINKSYVSFGRKFDNKGAISRVVPYISGEYTVRKNGEELFKAGRYGLRVSSVFDSQIVLESRPSNKIRIAEDGEWFDVDQSYIAIALSPSQLISSLSISSEIGDRIDYLNNRVGSGYYLDLVANIRPLSLLEVELGVTEELVKEKTAMKKSFSENVSRLIANLTLNESNSLRLIANEKIVDRNPFATVDSTLPLKERYRIYSFIYEFKKDGKLKFYLGTTGSRDKILGADSVTVGEYFSKISYDIK